MRIGISLTSSMHVGDEYIALTRRVAERLAAENFGIVFGGTSYGMMHELATAYKSNNGKDLVGVMAEDLMRVTKGYKAYDRLDAQFLEPTMEARKHRMAQLSDGFLVLPGGYGTFEELGSFIGGNVNKLCSKPVVLYNHDNFYDTLIAFFDEILEKKFSKIDPRDAMLVTSDLEEAIRFFRDFKPNDLADKFI